MEIFKPTHIKGEFYSISNLGNVISNRTKKKLYLNTATKGYKTVNMYNGELKRPKIHRLVAIAFIPNPENKPQVNHINSIRTDNRIENLEWVTNKENIIHSFKNGRTAKSVKGEDRPNSILTEKDIPNIRNMINMGISIKSLFITASIYFSIHRYI